VLTAFYDLFVGISSFVAGGVAHAFGYRAVFLMAAGAIAIAALIGRYVFSDEAAGVSADGEPAYLTAH
jgi:hypothetical protein